MNIHLFLRDCNYSDHQVPLKRHFHFGHEIIFIRKGSSNLMIGDRTYSLGRGSLVFINNLEEHSISNLSKHYERYFLIMFSERLEHLIGDNQLTCIFKYRPPSYSHVIDVSTTIDEVDWCFSKINDEYHGKQLCSCELVSALLKQILIYAYRSDPNRFSFASTSLQKQILLIQNYIESNYQNNIKISDIASRYYISPYYLSHKFKQQTGYSPKQYLVHVRLAHAKEMLSSEDCSINNVAFRCGFTDTNNFIRMFKDYIGVTPLKYKKRE